MQTRFFSQKKLFFILIFFLLILFIKSESYENNDKAILEKVISLFALIIITSYNVILGLIFVLLIIIRIEYITRFENLEPNKKSSTKASPKASTKTTKSSPKASTKSSTKAKSPPAPAPAPAPPPPPPPAPPPAPATKYSNGETIMKLSNQTGYYILNNITGDPNAKRYTEDDRERYRALFPPETKYANGQQIQKLSDDPETAHRMLIGTTGNPNARHYTDDDRERYRALFRPPTTYADGNPIIKLNNGEGYRTFNNYTKEDKNRYLALYDYYPLPPKKVGWEEVDIEQNTKVGINDVAIMTKGSLSTPTDVTEKLKGIFDDPSEVTTQSASRSQTLTTDGFNKDKDRLSPQVRSFIRGLANLTAPGSH